ncbi:hypothetical protein BC939DRAFT_439009 [Gamsiella multidivaricata]|uniref:uncharacterized protein n=1 Tax=Gamsiella multidivaricata TaxID=101098 RepID=UPI00221F9696|nr:uncharacterized protein BC939DRAFT_439009 [Gamsiella multidivaricata]KAI7830763.1 hypothetical protein BC939DRAFT_439009 [Gamsiella multidivaricata]
MRNTPVFHRQRASSTSEPASCVSLHSIEDMQLCGYVVPVPLLKRVRHQQWRQLARGSFSETCLLSRCMVYTYYEEVY